MSGPAVPYSVPYDLFAVPASGAEIILSPSAKEREAISGWLGIEALDSLKAAILISREGDDQFACSAHFTADVVQACVVTLEPVRAHLSGEFRRSFKVLRRSHSARRRQPAESAQDQPVGIDISLLDTDEPEILESPVVDLAAPLLEELSLALDPYPRAPGATFEAPPEETGPTQSPFEVLQKLKAPERVTKPVSPAKKRH